MSSLHCLRCKTVSLVETDHPPDIEFFQCPACDRCYALKPGKQLTFRWRHPITNVLYYVLFEAKPVKRAQSIARKFGGWYSREILENIVKEIRLELDDPTQQVRDALDSRASEEDCRQFLASFCDCVERDFSLATPDEPTGN